jgi:hypothetical protein
MHGFERDAWMFGGSSGTMTGAYCCFRESDEKEIRSEPIVLAADARKTMSFCNLSVRPFGQEDSSRWSRP